MDNVKTVQGIYQAFGRGDVPWILERMADDVEWEYGQGPTEVPWLSPGRGRDAVLKFFQTVGAELEFHAFTPTAIVAGPGGLVIALCDLDATAKRTGKRLREVDEAHLWRFDERGRVKRFRHRVDSQEHARVLK